MLRGYLSILRQCLPGMIIHRHFRSLRNILQCKEHDVRNILFGDGVPDGIVDGEVGEARVTKGMSELTDEQLETHGLTSKISSSSHISSH